VTVGTVVSSKINARVVDGKFPVTRLRVHLGSSMSN
jgi:hypothetical protein